MTPLMLWCVWCSVAGSDHLMLLDVSRRVQNATGNQRSGIWGIVGELGTLQLMLISVKLGIERKRIEKVGKRGLCIHICDTLKEEEETCSLPSAQLHSWQQSKCSTKPYTYRYMRETIEGKIAECFQA